MRRIKTNFGPCHFAADVSMKRLYIISWCKSFFQRNNSGFRGTRRIINAFTKTLYCDSLFQFTTEWHILLMFATALSDRPHPCPASSLLHWLLSTEMRYAGFKFPDFVGSTDVITTNFINLIITSWNMSMTLLKWNRINHFVITSFTNRKFRSTSCCEISMARSYSYIREVPWPGFSD